MELPIAPFRDAAYRHFRPDCRSEPNSIYNSDALASMYDGVAQYVLSAHKFTGEERDSESGLDNFGVRYNASTMGRFITPDQLLNSGHPSNPQTWNRYSYTSTIP